MFDSYIYVLAWNSSQFLVFGRLNNDFKLNYCDGKIGNFLWWNTQLNCFENDESVNDIMENVFNGVKGKPSPLLTSYYLTTGGIFRYQRNLTTIQGILTNITQNIFQYFNQQTFPSGLVLSSNEKGKLFLFDYANSSMYWMDEDNTTSWYKKFFQ